MQERGRVMVAALVILLLVLALGFFVHRDPRFAGSLAGGALGISAASLMLVPLAHSLVKRIPLLRRVVTPRVSMRSLLAIHVYSGALAPLLGILHTGHKFQSPLGIALSSMMILVAVSGYVGRYLLGRLSTDIREKRVALATLERSYSALRGDLAGRPETARALRPFASLGGRLVGALFVESREDSRPAAADALRLAESISDLEYALRTDELAKSTFARWLSCHIVVAIVLYTLLFIHIWSVWYFGIRWLA